MNARTASKKNEKFALDQTDRDQKERLFACGEVNSNGLKRSLKPIVNWMLRTEFVDSVRNAV